MLVNDVIAKLDNDVSELTGRIFGAADFSMLIATNALPLVTPAAFVLPLGFDASANARMSGMHSQQRTERIGVVLLVGSAADATGAESLTAIDKFVDLVTLALAGWKPASGDIGFDVLRGRMLDLREGLCFYQIDFSTQRLLRV